MASYDGTLASARCLGRAGIPVVVADSRLLAPARWSRFVTRRVGCPEVPDTRRFLDWLIAFGKRSPGLVLYPTSDDLAWLLARHRAELEPYFRLYQPDVEVIYRLLNKQRLFDACHEVGIEAPETRFPADDAELERLARELSYPVLIKPKTQILFTTRVKGRRIDAPDALVDGYRAFVRGNRYGAELTRHDPDVVRPMIQAFRPEAAESIYSVSGFVDEHGVAAFRAAVKVLQRPRKLGVGLCFEAAPVIPELASRLLELCRRTGYFGVFEAEFIQVAGRFLMIDFNPRFYGQMGFDVARHLPLPVLVYEAALGERESVREMLARAATQAMDGSRIYCHRMVFKLLLAMQTLSGKLTAAEGKDWRAWYARNRAFATDAIHDADDLLPTFIDFLSHVTSYARHPRHFVRSMILDH